MARRLSARLEKIENVSQKVFDKIYFFDMKEGIPDNLPDHIECCLPKKLFDHRQK